MSSPQLSREAREVLKKLAGQESYSPKKKKWISAAEELVSKDLARKTTVRGRTAYVITEAGRKLALEWGMIRGAGGGTAPIATPLPRTEGAQDLLPRIEALEDRLSSIERSLGELLKEVRRGFEEVMRAVGTKRISEARALSAVRRAVLRFSGPTGWAPISDVLKSLGGELGEDQGFLLNFLSDLEDRGLCELAPGGVREFSVGGRLVGLIRWKGD